MNNQISVDFHAKSVDFTNIPSKLNLTAGSSNLFPQNYYPNPNINNNNYQHHISKNNPNYYYPSSLTSEQINNYNNYYENVQNNNFRHVNNDKLLIDNIFLYIRDQNGCRIIQKKIEEKNKEFLSYFFEKVLLFLI